MQTSWLLTEIMAQEQRVLTGPAERYRAEALAEARAPHGLRAALATALVRLGMRVDANAVRTAAAVPPAASAPAPVAR
jgi:hypothetical protein